MHDQPKYVPLRESAFFDDSRSARPVIAGTVARGQLNDDPLLATGKLNGADATVFPAPVDAKAMLRGQERFNIYCTPCHDRTGSGEGMIVQRGYKQPPSFHDPRLRSVPDGYFFQVMTNGFATMPSYRTQVGPRDRWAIVAYIRALQLSQNATLADVPADEQAKLDQPKSGAAE
jgi:mono/diheme cytochrome c family protein